MNRISFIAVFLSLLFSVFLGVYYGQDQFFSGTAYGWEALFYVGLSLFFASLWAIPILTLGVILKIIGFRKSHKQLKKYGEILILVASLTFALVAIINTANNSGLFPG